MLRLYDYAASANCYKARPSSRSSASRTSASPSTSSPASPLRPSTWRATRPGGPRCSELDSGQTIAESNAILLYLGEGTPFAGGARRARSWQWLFFEQNLFEPNVGTARLAPHRPRDAQARGFAARLDSARAAFDTLDRGLAACRFLPGEVYTVADVSLYAYAHVAGDAGIDMGEYGEVGAWLRRVEATPGFVNDLEPYPPGATAGAGGPSVHG